MPVKFFKEFNVMLQSFEIFIEDYYNAVVAYLDNPHKKILGQVDPQKNEGKEWDWAVIRVSNDDIGIEMAICLNSLYVHAYRRVLPNKEESNPWMVIRDKREGFSGLRGDLQVSNFDGLPEKMTFDGELVDLGFSGGYNDDIKDSCISRQSFKDAVYSLNNLAKLLSANYLNNQSPDPKPLDREKGRKGFLMGILLLAESLRIKPVRDRIELAFNSDEAMKLGRKLIFLAQNWQVISDAYLSSDYSEVPTFSDEILGDEKLCNNDEEAESILWLLLNSPAPAKTKRE